MISKDNPFIHKGLQRLWDSEGGDHSGVLPSLKKNLRANLVHLSIARSLQDLQADLGQRKRLKPLSGHANRYSMEVNGNWRLTFTLDDAVIGLVSKIDLEDTHQPGGARRH